MSTRFSATRLKLLGSGSALPGRSVDNDELLSALRERCGAKAAKVAAKFANRLGIRSRHLSRDLERARSGTQSQHEAPTLCKQALEAAMPDAQMTYLIGHTATPHTLLPANISWVAESMRYEGPYVELRQACTGFAAGLTIAAAMVAEDPLAKIGIVGSETGSPYFDIDESFLDTDQLVNYVQMGDGAGAVMLGADDGADGHVISDIYYGHSGLDMQPGIGIEGGGSADPACDKGLPFFRHRARDVRKHGERLITDGIAAIESRGYSLDDFDWIVPHQANGLIAELFVQRFPAAMGKVFVIADQLGNLGSAAIWVALDRLRHSAMLEPGHRVLVLGAEASKYIYGGFIYTH